ncbi:MAG TPA: hypothetical protein GX400_17465 [Chloroflexi bacterium]|nr:hypothetical protein [Chloroflexota bacterium]
MSPRWRTAGVLLFYIGLTLLLTWPLVTRFTTHVPGDGIDDPALAWNLWWLRTRLVTQANADIFHTDWMFHPIQINLAFYTLTPLNGLLSIPLQLGLSLIVASNLVLLASFVLGAFGAYLLVLDQRWWVAPHRAPPADTPLARINASDSAVDTTIWYVAALFSGVIYAFASSKLFYASLGQFNIASSQWIPFCVLYLLRMVRPEKGLRVRRLRLRAAALAALFFGLQLWAELTYASFLLIFVALLFVWQLGVQWRQLQRKWGELLLPFLTFGLLAGATLLPLLWAMAPDLRSEGDFFASGGGFADVFSADLLGYLVTTRLHPVWGKWVATLPFPNDKGQHIFLGYSALLWSALGLWMLARRHRALAWGWGLCLLLFFLLTLGPTVRWHGQDTGIPGPFALVSQLPFFSGNRYPSRYSVMLMLTVAVTGGLGVVWLLEHCARRGWRRARVALTVVMTAGALFLFEHLATPLPLSDFRIPDIYGRLAQTPGDFAVLELPTGWRNGARVLGKADLLIMMQQWWQTEHGKRRLGGNTSRNPAYKFQYFTQAPLLGDLIALMNADRPHIGAVVDAEFDAMVAANRPRAGQILRDLGIGAILVHEEKATSQLRRFIDAALPVTAVDRWHGVDATGAPATIVRYAVTLPDPPAERTIFLADADAPLYLGEGWATLPTGDGIRYATRSEAILLLDLPEAGGRLRLEWVGPAETVEVTVNGRQAALESMASGRAEVVLTPGLADQPVDHVGLHFVGAPQPAGAVATPPNGVQWSIGKTVATLPAACWLVVQSAGEEVGDFAHIYVNGQDVAAGGRGYNLTAIANDGRVLDSVVFDTSGDDAAAAALTSWLAQWPEGTIIAGAVNDEASLKLDEAAVKALQTVGVMQDLRGRLRWSHAFVGAVGAPVGAAVEASALLQPASVTVGAPIDGAKVYGGVRAVTIQRNADEAGKD